jgi:hypothetical protein
MIRLFLCLAFLSCATAASAQSQISVRGGEHDGFTRLVLNLRQTQDWSMVETPSGYRIELSSWSAGFNLSGVFQKMTRDRISAVAATQNAISFDVACQCQAEASQLTSGVIFVDISPADPPAPEPDLALVDEQPEPAQNEQVTVAPEPVTLPAFTPRAIKLLPPTPPAEDLPAPQLDGLRESLLNGLQRSAGLSLIELDTDPSDPLAAPDALTEEAKERIKISDAFERSATFPNGARPDPDTQPSLATCPMPESYDISLWGEPDTFATQLATLRRDMLSEFDRINPQDVIDLGQLYLYFGLGTEARMVTRTFETPASDATRITALAQIIEPDSNGPNKQGPDHAPFGDLAHCAGTLTPWLLLASPRTATLTDATLRDLTTTFSTWPAHLRSLLGPPIVATLTTRGFDAPASVIRSLAMMSQPAQTDTPFKNTDFDDMPMAELRDLIDEGGDKTAAALSTYLARAARDRAPLDPIYIELAEAYERETQGLSVSDALNLSRIAALGHIGRFTEARTVLQERLALDAPVPGDVLEALVTQALSRADPFEIASSAMFAARINRLTDLPEGLILELSKAALDAGLPDLSAKIMAALDTPPAQLQAEIEAAEFESETALATLDPLSDIQADALRVQLLLNAGRAEQIWAEDQNRLRPEQKSQVAWAAKEWAQVESDAVRSELAQLLDGADAPFDADKPIAQATELEASSAKARALISEMLAPPPS